MRKAATEAAKKGLIILDAAYGLLEGYQTPTPGQLAAVASAAAARRSAAEAAAAVTAAAAAPSGAGAAAADGATAASLPASAAAAEDDGEAAAAAASGAGQPAEGAAPAAQAPAARPWLDATLVLQQLVERGRLGLHEGVPKAGLPGFTDPAPGAAKALRVAYAYQGTVFEATVGEEQALALPGGGRRVLDADRLAALAAAASARYGLQLEARDGGVRAAAAASALPGGVAATAPEDGGAAAGL